MDETVGTADESVLQETKESRPTHQASRVLSWLGGNRDGLLVLATVMYVFGYLVWAVYAWDNNLGLLPLISAQYLVVGLIPMIILSFLALVLYAGESLVLPLADRYPVLATRRATMVFSYLLATLFFLAAIPIVIPISRETSSFDLVSIEAIIYLLSVWVPCAIIVWNPLARRYRYVYFGIDWEVYVRMVMVMLVAVWFALTYYTYVFLNIPQAIGGADPRCAVLDIDSSKVSVATLELLDPVNPPTADSTAVRTKELRVLFSGGDTVIVRVDDNVFEVDRDAVLVTDGCDE